MHVLQNTLIIPYNIHISKKKLSKIHIIASGDLEATKNALFKPGWPTSWHNEENSKQHYSRVVRWEDNPLTSINAIELVVSRQCK